MTEIYEDASWCIGKDHVSSISAEVTDPSGVQTVKISWTAFGDFFATGSTELSASGDTWTGDFGPFGVSTLSTGASERVGVTVTATDAEGNTTTVANAVFVTVSSSGLC